MQPHLIYKIVTYLHLYDNKVKSRYNIETSPKVLKRHLVSETHDGYFNYI